MSAKEYIHTFKRVDGKVIAVKKERYKESGKKANYSTRKAKSMIHDEILDMAQEVSGSQKSSSVFRTDERGSILERVYIKSTFPKYFRNIGVGSAKEFLRVATSKKGVRYKRMKEEAIQRLNHGYENDHGHNDPDLDFKVASKQAYDNKDVIFRKIGGRIVPIKVTKRNRHDLLAEAPF